jgi:hypothetical protein
MSEITGRSFRRAAIPQVSQKALALAALDVHPKLVVGLVLDAEEDDIGKTDQQLADARRV